MTFSPPLCDRQQVTGTRMYRRGGSWSVHAKGGHLSVFLCVLLALILHARDTALALCPSNGNTHVIYVTSNMGDNIWAFDTAGQYIGNVLNKESFPFRVDKLRDMRFGPENYLYISSALGRYSRIFAVSGNGLLNGTLNKNCTRDYLFTVTKQSSDNPFLDHPYGMAFHPVDGSLFVANQNSATVTKYRRADKNQRDGVPLWEPIENVKHVIANAPSSVWATDKAGLFASSWSSEYALLSVRGLAISPLLPRALVEQGAPAGLFATGDTLLAYYVVVCDIAMNRLHVFLAETGENVFSISVPSPVQVLFPSRYHRPIKAPASYFEVPYVYVTSKENGMAYLVPFVAPSPLNDTSITTDIAQYRKGLYAITRPLLHRASSGIYENPSHDMLLIADRVGRKVSLFASPFLTNYESGAGPSVFLGYFLPNLPDQPEFILTTMVEQQHAIPFCYELSADGTFRYVALCTAAYIWAAALLFFCVCGLIAFLIREIWMYQERCGNRRRGKQRLSDLIGSEDSPLILQECTEKYGTNGGDANP